MLGCAGCEWQQAAGRGGFGVMQGWLEEQAANSCRQIPEPCTRAMSRRSKTERVRLVLRAGRATAAPLADRSGRGGRCAPAHGVKLQEGVLRALGACVSAAMLLVPPAHANASAWSRSSAARVVAASLLALLVGYNAGWTMGRRRSAGVFGEHPAGSLLGGGAKTADVRRAREACTARLPGGKVRLTLRSTCTLRMRARCSLLQRMSLHDGCKLPPGLELSSHHITILVSNSPLRPMPCPLVCAPTTCGSRAPLIGGPRDRLCRLRWLSLVAGAQGARRRGNRAG